MNQLFIFPRTTEENKYNSRMVKFVIQGGTLLDKKNKEEGKGSSLKSEGL